MTFYKNDFKPQVSEKGVENLCDPDDFLGRGVKKNNSSAWEEKSAKPSPCIKQKRRDDSL